MIKRYPDCQRADGNCEMCSLSSYGRDCKNNPSGVLAYYRSKAGLTQQAVADAAGIPQRKYQRYEYGTTPFGKADAETALAVARALGVTVEELLDL